MLTRHSTRRRILLVSLFAAGVLPSVGCGGAGLGAKMFAERYIHGQINKERALARTCEALGKTKDTSSPLGRDLNDAKAHNGKVLARAICGEAEKAGVRCSYDPTTFAFSISDPSKLGDSAEALLEMLARDPVVGKGSSGPDVNLLQRADVLLKNGEIVEKLLAKTTMARVGLFVALKLADGAQGVVEQTASSFGILEGFARPVLERVASEIVAAAMDKTFEIVENTYKVPRTNLTQEACTVYERREPRSSVAAHVLERAILRYSQPIDHKDLFRDIYQTDCNDLAEWIHPSGPLDASVCHQILTSVAAEEASRGATVETLLEPKAPPPIDDTKKNAVLDENAVEMAAHALVWSAAACKKEFAGERASACTLDRVMPVASIVYSDSIIQGKSEEPAVHFDDFEQRLVALEREITNIHAEGKELQKKLLEQKADMDAKQAALEKTLLEQRLLVETIVKQDAALRDLTRGMMDLAVRAFDEKCRARYEQTQEARDTLAKALGFEKLCDKAAGPHSDAWVSSTNKLFSAQPSTYCRPELPITLEFASRFKGCDFQVDCTKEDSKSLCAALDLIASSVVLGNGAKPNAERRPLRLIGYASILPTGDTCVPKLTSASPLVVDKVEYLSNDAKDEAAMKLSALRADFTARALFEKWPAARNALVEITAAGTANVTEIGNFKIPSKEAETQEAFQRVSIQLNLDTYSFPLKTCLGR